jgi:hypothetical protein
MYRMTWLAIHLPHTTRTIHMHFFRVFRLFPMLRNIWKICDRDWSTFSLSSKVSDVIFLTLSSIHFSSYFEDKARRNEAAAAQVPLKTDVIDSSRLNFQLSPSRNKASIEKQQLAAALEHQKVRTVFFMLMVYFSRFSKFRLSLFLKSITDSLFMEIGKISLSPPTTSHQKRKR